MLKDFYSVLKMKVWSLYLSYKHDPSEGQQWKVNILHSDIYQFYTAKLPLTPTRSVQYTMKKFIKTDPTHQITQASVPIPSFFIQRICKSSYHVRLRLSVHSRVSVQWFFWFWWLETMIQPYTKKNWSGNPALVEYPVGLYDIEPLENVHFCRLPWIHLSSNPVNPTVRNQNKV